MKFDFDTVYDRKNTDSLKYDFAAERGKPTDLLPLWVADMDFPAPPEVLAALQAKATHGIFGYSEPKADYYAAIAHWFAARHGWQAAGERFVHSPGVVFSLATLLNAVTSEGDAVLVCQPVYYPFSQTVTANRRKLVVSELINTRGYYTVDFEDFENKIRDNNVKAFILCSPHNPVGRVWSREELLRMGDICLQYGVFVISDEIHCDFVFGQNKHTVFASLGEDYAQNCAVCTAPTKTFNLAGLHIANTYIHNDALRKKVAAALDAQGYSQPNVMGFTACRAAYTHGAPWLDALLGYLSQSFSLMREYIQKNMPQIGFAVPQGTYLAWLDCRGLGISDGALRALVQDKAKLWTDDGIIFGAGGRGFERINIACPHSVLRKALEQLAYALHA